MDETYIDQIVGFVRMLNEQQPGNHWSFDWGRKYDKVILQANLDTDTDDEVRYFVERTTGDIYGARSNTTPNLSWYFGNLDRCHLWDWSGHHGMPVNDDTVRPVGRYGPYIKYMKV